MSTGITGPNYIVLKCLYTTTRSTSLGTSAFGERVHESVELFVAKVEPSVYFKYICMKVDPSVYFNYICMPVAV